MRRTPTLGRARSLAGIDPAAALADALEADLRPAGDPGRAAGERAYLRSDLDFLGVPRPAVRRAVARLGRRPHDELVALARALWSKPVFERRIAAVELLARSAPALVPGDSDLLEHLIRQSRTWALVDPVAVNVAGALVAAHREVGPTLDRWAADADFWLRRAALLALLRPIRAGGGDADRFFGYADAMLDEREFFVRKAIGWVLRDMGRRRPEVVGGWLAPRAHRASGVTMREAVKHLRPEDQQALMAAYRSGSPAVGGDRALGGDHRAIAEGGGTGR